MIVTIFFVVFVFRFLEFDCISSVGKISIKKPIHRCSLLLFFLGEEAVER